MPRADGGGVIRGQGEDGEGVKILTTYPRRQEQNDKWQYQEVNAKHKWMAKRSIPGSMFQKHKVWEAQECFLRWWFPTLDTQQKQLRDKNPEPMPELCSHGLWFNWLGVHSRHLYFPRSLLWCQRVLVGDPLCQGAMSEKGRTCAPWTFE